MLTSQPAALFADPDREDRLKRTGGLDRNQWPDWADLPGRIKPFSVAGLVRNAQRELEIALGIDATKLKTCDGARKFVIKIVPSLAHASSLPALLKQHLESTDESDVGLLEPQLAQFTFCVRHGFDKHEKAALYVELREERLSRVMLHKRFKAIRPYLASASPDETWDETLRRVRTAIDAA